MPKPKVLITDHNVRPEGLDLLKENGVDLTILQAYSKPERVIEAANDVDGMLARVARISMDVLRVSPKLKIVSRHGVGYDNVDVEECTRLGIAVTTSGDANSEAVSEYAFAHMMAIARHLTRAVTEVKSGVWKRDGIVGVELHRKTLGIIGLGRIGSRLAKHAHGFEMDVLVYDPYPDKIAIEQLGAELMDLPTHCFSGPTSSLFTPLSPPKPGT